MSRFKDTTGRPGPANWALGRFPDGAADLPVHGISWYEAMAYARFRGKTLPPFHYWVRTTVALAEQIYPITPAMVTQSNFSGQLVEVGSSGGIGPYGTCDTAGNVAEWMYNTSGKNRMVMGGSATEPPYQGLLLMGGADSRHPGSRLQSEGHPLYEVLIQQALRAGRAVIWPEWYGTYERFADFTSASISQQSAYWRDHNLNWRKEADSIFSYLESTGEFDGNYTWYGFSYGAIYAVPRRLYLLPQIKTAILKVGGHSVADSTNMSYVRHITKPVLMLNGRYDMVIETWLSERLFESLGTPAQDKKMVVYDTGHSAPPRNQMAREMDDWLNRYLGPMEQ